MRSRAVWVVLGLCACSESPLTPPPPVSPPPPPRSDVIVLDASPSGAADPAGAAKAPRTPEVLARTWSARSADGRAEVSQTGLAEGERLGCESRATLLPPDTDGPEAKPQTLWAWNTCLALRDQLRFVSPDGQRLLMIDPAPALSGNEWMGVELAALYEHGVRVRVLKARAVWGMPRVVQQPAPHLEWMKGHGGEPGAPARYVSDGQAVAFESLDGRAWRLAFSGEGFPAASEEASAYTEREALVRYQDAQGTVHIVRSLDEVPRRFRDRAGPVTAKVDVRASPKPPVAPVAPKNAPPEAAAAATPGDLLERAEQAARKVEEARREQEKLLRSPP